MRALSRMGSNAVKRRTFLHELAALVGASAALPYVTELSAQPLEPKLARLSEKLLVVQGVGGNVVCADSADGIVMIDGGHASWRERLRSAIAQQFPARPVGALFNTHWHPEQTGSNVALGETGVPIISHENTKLWLGTEVWVRWSDTHYPALPKAGLPTKTFYDSGTMMFGGRSIEYGYIPKAHTDGDAWVLLPEENVLVAGGPVSNDTWPIIDWWTGGWTGGMLDGFDSLLEIANDRTRIVPASGPVMSLAELKAQQQMYLAVFGRVHELLLKAKDTNEVLAANPTAGYRADWGDPAQFVTLAFQSTWGHLRDVYDTRLMSLP